jgi:hypothetical protein
MDVEDEYDCEVIYAIGLKVLEMAERAKVMHTVVPGAQANWRFEIDGTRFCVSLIIEEEKGS